MEEGIDPRMIQRHAPLNRSPIPTRRKKPRRVSVDRNRPYLDWLKEQRCVVTRLHGFPAEIVNKPQLHWKTRIVDPAHGPPAGLRVKGSGSGAIPLTRWYHEEQTRIGWDALEEKYQFSREAEAKAHFALFQIVSEDYQFPRTHNPDRSSAAP